MWRRRPTSKRDYFLNRFPLEDPDIFRSAEIAPAECATAPQRTGGVCNLRLIARAGSLQIAMQTMRRPFTASEVARTSRITLASQRDAITTLLIN